VRRVADKNLNQRGVNMDKKIRQLEKEESKVGRGLKTLEKMDKKRDAVCEVGEKMKEKLRIKRGR